MFFTKFGAILVIIFHASLTTLTSNTLSLSPTFKSTSLSNLNLELLVVK